MSTLVTTLDGQIANNVGFYINVWHSSFQLAGFKIPSDGNTWASESLATSLVIPVSSGQKFKIKGTGAQFQSYAFLKSASPVDGQSVDFATGYSGKVSLTTTPVEITAPSDANYLFITGKIGETIQGIDYLLRIE